MTKSKLELLRQCHLGLVEASKLSIIRDWTREKPFNVCLHAEDETGKLMTTQKALDFRAGRPVVCSNGHSHPLKEYSAEKITVYTTIGDTDMAWQIDPQSKELYQVGDLCFCQDANCTLHGHNKRSQSTVWLVN